MRCVHVTLIALAALLLAACATERDPKCVVTPTNVVECN
jgi:PBP1b-binding outer membrane lipoprotein LpoB